MSDWLLHCIHRGCKLEEQSQVVEPPVVASASAPLLPATYGLLHKSRQKEDRGGGKAGGVLFAELSAAIGC